MNERIYQFGSAGDAAEWFINVAVNAQAVIGSDIMGRTQVRPDGGGYVALLRTLYTGGYHVGYAVALEGDMVVIVIMYSKPPLAVATVAEQLSRSEAAAGHGITRPVPSGFPTSLP